MKTETIKNPWYKALQGIWCRRGFGTVRTVRTRKAGVTSFRWDAVTENGVKVAESVRSRQEATRLLEDFVSLNRVTSADPA